MFPTQSDRLVFEDSSIFEQDKILDDLLAECAAMEDSGLTDKGYRKRARKPSSANEGSSYTKKTVHRDIERQRRQEMASMYASLRSLLPLEYVKGKRAITDHMHQAANYIKDMRKKIEEMKIRRDKLKKLSNVVGAAIDGEDPNSNISDSPCVNVSLFGDGMEILIKSSFNVENFPISKVLAELLGRGLNVISCVSTRGDRLLLHKLQIELNDATSIDPPELQQTLVNLIKLH